MTLEAIRTPTPRAEPQVTNGPGVHAQPVLPPLESGDRLTRAEFERRYSARPDISKAELIEGVVYVSSPVRVQQHGEPHSHMIGCLMFYCAATPGVRISDNSALRLDTDNLLQPDICLWIDQDYGGRVQITPDDYLAGAPELIVEVAASSAAYDLHDKRNAYRRNGVQEYVVLLPYERRTVWYVWNNGEYQELLPAETGVLRSQVFPGLWLSSAHFWASDLAGLLDVLKRGLATPEHAAFVDELASRRDPLPTK